MLNKQGPKKIDWTDYTWNPITGCYHNCSYCYMKRMAKRFKGIMEYKFHPDRLSDLEKLREPAKIFVGSSGDMWGEWVKAIHLDPVIECVAKYPHIFQFLTKNPINYINYDLISLPNLWAGTTVDGSRFTERNLEIMQLEVSAPIKFISFEPLLKPINPGLSGIEWVIIGANSNRGAKKPPDEWADLIVKSARENNCAVWVKNNYKYHTIIKEFPQ